MTAGVTVDRVLQALRELCPPRYALEGDKTGLQVGQGDRRIERVLATMDLTLAVAEERLAHNVPAEALGGGAVARDHRHLSRAH